MKQSPLRRYVRPAYPTLSEAPAVPELLTALPRRWARPPFAALLGAGLLARSLTSNPPRCRVDPRPLQKQFPTSFVFGSEGTLRFCDDKLFGGRRGDNELREIPIPANKAGRWRVEEEFVGAIRGTEPVKLTTFADGVKYMEFTEAVGRSIETGTAVKP